MGEFVLYEVEGRIATVTLNRPERLNAMNTPLINELVGYLEQAADDTGVTSPSSRAPAAPSRPATRSASSATTTASGRLPWTAT